MIRVRTLWPHRVGGLTYWSPDAGYWRVNAARTKWCREGRRRSRRGDYWLHGPGRECQITWWRAQRLAKAAKREPAP
jgi:hypothetical protein